MRYFAILLTLAAQLLVVSLPIALSQGPSMDSWNQFRGPDRIGAVDYTLPDQMPDGGPELLWKRPVGSAFSELAVVGDRVYTMFSEAVDTTSGTEYLAAFDAATGDELWRVKTDSLFFDQFGNGPRSTPLVDGDMVYCLSSHGKLSAHRTADGSMAWQTDLVKEFGSTLPRWGFSTSPVLLGDMLILEAGGTDSRGFAGFGKETGKAVWSWGDGVAYYTSPVVVTIDGKEQVLFASQTTLYSFDASGDTLWTCPVSMNGPMASPVMMDGNRIFISTVRSQGFCVVEVKDGRPKEVLNGSTMKNDFSSSVYHNGFIYGFDVAALQCISATTGEKRWTKRGLGKGSLIRVGDQLMVLSDKGNLLRVKATEEAYKELGSFQALEGKSWTAPSFSDGKLYVRNLTEMACYKFN